MASRRASAKAPRTSCEKRPNGLPSCQSAVWIILIVGTDFSAKWDLQVDLYRNMTVRISDRDGVEIEEISSSIGTWPDRAAVAYHLMNDGGVLINGAIDLPLSARVENIEGEIAVQAMAKLETRITSLRAGRLDTNSASDPKFFEKTAFMGLYAFESSPLVTAFMRSDAENEMSDGEYYDD